jgi:hypothetical protein
VRSTSEHLLQYLRRMLEQMLAFVNDEIKENEDGKSNRKGKEGKEDIT